MPSTLVILGISLPVVYVCSNCGRALSTFYGDSSKGLPTLGKVLDEYAHAGKYLCYCGAELYPDPDLIEVLVIPVSTSKKFVEKYKEKKEKGSNELRKFYEKYAQSSDEKKREMFLKMWKYKRALVETIESMEIRKRSKDLKNKLRKK